MTKKKRLRQSHYNSHCVLVKLTSIILSGGKMLFSLLGSVKLTRPFVSGSCQRLNSQKCRSVAAISKHWRVVNDGKARGLIPSHSSREFSFFLFSKLKRPLGKRESPVGKEVRTIQASTHHCSQTPWGLGLLLSLGYPVGLVPLYGAGAWNEVRRLLRWNLITTKCRRDCENIFNVTGIGYIVVLFHFTCTRAQVRRTKLL